MKQHMENLVPKQIFKKKKNSTGIIIFLISKIFVISHYYHIFIGFAKYAFFRLKDGN